MWIRVALSQDAIHFGKEGNPFIDGKDMEEYFFDDKVAMHLDEDNFLAEMWGEFNALFDWGDCDYFSFEKCDKLKRWLDDRLSKELLPDVKEVYNVMLDYSNKAVCNKTGMYFDF